MTEDLDKYRTGLRRMLAALIDGVILSPILFVEDYFRSSDNKILLILGMIAVSTLTYSYTIFLHARYGQTLGKMALKIKVTTLKTESINFKISLIRDSGWVLMDTALIGYYSYNILQTNTPSQELLNAYDWHIFIALLSWLMLELITLFTNKKRRALHDFIAGTVVIKI